MYSTEWVIPRWRLFILGILAVGIMTVEELAARVIADNATKVATACTVQGPAVESSTVHLKLDCGGRKLMLADASVIVSYLANPGPLSCNVSASGRFSCAESK